MRQRAVLAIALTTVLFTSLFTIAASINYSLQQENFRQAGGDCHGSIKDISWEQVEELRTQALNRALASRASAVSLPAYDHGGWLWDADSAFKMEQYYYRKTPGDLTITFVPGAQWEG